MSTQNQYTQHLLIQIEVLREKLIRTGMKYGLQHCKTIKISQELDRMLNQYEANGTS